MALDTADKRSSAVNIGSPWRGLLPFPSGSIDQQDRQHIAYMYRGIAADAPSGGGPLGGVFIPIFRPRRR